jgi:hypothetical protein
LSHRFENFDVVKCLYLLVACSNRPRFILWISQANAHALANFEPWSKDWMNELQHHPPFGISAITGQDFEAYNPLAVVLHESMVPGGECLHYTSTENIQYICTQRSGLLPGGIQGKRKQMHFCLCNPDHFDLKTYVYPSALSSDDIVHPYAIPPWLTAGIHIDIKSCREIGLTPVVHPGYSGTFAPKRVVPLEAINSVVDHLTGRIIWFPPRPPQADAVPAASPNMPSSSSADAP